MKTSIIGPIARTVGLAFAIPLGTLYISSIHCNHDNQPTNQIKPIEPEQEKLKHDNNEPKQEQKIRKPVRRFHGRTMIA